MRDLAVDAVRQAELERLEAALEGVQAALEADDVGLAEHGRLDRVGRVLDQRRERERERRAGRHALEAAVARAHLPERVAQARVDDEPAGLDAALDLLVVDDERAVVLLDLPARGAPRTCSRGTPSASGVMLSNAFPWSAALCVVCASERSGKWKTSIGNQPRSGANGLSITAWLPARERDLGVRAVDDLADRLVQRRRVVDRRERREAHGHPLERILAPGPRDEHPQERADGAVARRAPRRARRAATRREATRTRRRRS